MTDYERLGTQMRRQSQATGQAAVIDYGNFRGKCLVIHLSGLSAHCITAVFGGRVCRTCVALPHKPLTTR